MAAVDLTPLLRKQSTRRLSLNAALIAAVVSTMLRKAIRALHQASRAKTQAAETQAAETQTMGLLSLPVTIILIHVQFASHFLRQLESIGLSKSW